jgi:tRNA-Thr(GGU) m(6)t(6)A37 methyltransferase TsaA
MTCVVHIDLTPIGYVTSPLRAPADAPSQASESTGEAARVVVREELVDALLGLDRYPYLWLVTWLHHGGDEPGPLQVVPRATAATGEVQGVFASRWPHRPNSIGLSLVHQVGIAGNVVTLAGADVVDGTPVLDIKPWFADCDLPPDRL